VHSDVVYDLQFSPQEALLASCGSDRMMKLIDVSSAKAVRAFEGHTGHVLGVAWRADGRSLATAGADKVVKIWDAKEGTQKKTLSGFNKEVTGVRYLGLEDRFVFAVGDGQVQSRNSNGDGRPALTGFSDYIHRISSSRDGEVIAAAGQDGVIRVWGKDGKIKVEFKR
jgi:WD40 repeat protein